MRIISGNLGGRIFESPHGHRTHPMSEKMRGAIFGILGDISGLSILDAFAGSGAIGLEAISRGASKVVSIEVDKKAHMIIDKNIKSLGVEDKITPVRAYLNAWSTRHASELFDIIVADPPYDNLPLRDLKVLPKHLKDNGLLILSFPKKADWYPFNGCKLLESKSYGDSTLYIYKAERG